MELPEGWRVGHTKNVSPQWIEQWAEYVGKATDAGDIRMLRVVLEDRKGWCFPVSVRNMSALLEDRAKELGVPALPVRAAVEEKPWHQRLAMFSDDRKPRLTETSKRMTGEAE